MAAIRLPHPIPFRSFHLPFSIRLSSTLSDHLKSKLTQRYLPVTHDYLSPQQSYLLSVSLADFLPRPSPSTSPPPATSIPPGLPSTIYPRRMPVGHHLVYFPRPSSLLVPDGTDPLQSPDEPFVRRMWAGGQIRFPPDGGPLLDGGRAACVEGIRGLALKRKESDQEVIVSFERRVALVDYDGEEDEEIRRRVWTADSGEQGEAVLIERRDLVFMGESPPAGQLHAAEQAKEGNEDQMLTPPQHPAFAHSIVPTRHLLFRYSALTFNTNPIHFDKDYCRTTEAQRNLLVHVPLSLTFMLTLLRHHLIRSNRVIREIEYSNLAPLYAEEEMRVCGREKAGGEGVWEVWCEGRDGGYAVRGIARTEEVNEEQARNLMHDMIYDLMGEVIFTGFQALGRGIVESHS